MNVNTGAYYAFGVAVSTSAWFSQLCFRLVRIWAELADGALRAARLLGEADTAAVVLEQVAEADPLLLRDDGR